jgi:sulfotransferase family protein
MARVDRPIIVTGCPRSGTTLLQLMLHAHPRIAIPPETRFVVRAYYRRNEFAPLTDPEKRRAFARWLVTTRRLRFADLDVDRDRVIRDIVDGPPTVGSALAAVFRAYAQRFDKPRWGDKRPGYFGHLPEVLRMFPSAQIVSIVRDGRDCVASLKEAAWYKEDVDASISMWTQAIDYGRRAAHDLPADTYYELQYEGLVSAPEDELRKLCVFLGEDYDPAMLEPRRLAPVAVPEGKDWHALTHQPLTSSRVGSHDARLEPRELALCEAVMSDRLTSYGYQLTGAPRPSYRDLLRYRRVDTARRTAVTWRRARDRVRRLNEEPVAARLG